MPGTPDWSSDDLVIAGPGELAFVDDPAPLPAHGGGANGRLAGVPSERNDRFGPVELRTAPPNSLFFVGDEHGEPPPVLEHPQIWAASASSLVTATQAEVDGDTRLRLSEPDTVADRPTLLACETTLELSRRELTIQNAHFETYMRIDVAEDAARVRVWVDDGTWPSDIVIEVSPSRQQVEGV
jgi:hypothetical protein